MAQRDATSGAVGRTPGDATAVAHPNIALIKYWGKRDSALNLPAAGSASITLDTLRTTTRVQLIDGASDELRLDGRRLDACSGAGAARIVAVLDLLRAEAATDQRVRVTSENTFPTGAGLASSASGFAALVTAAGAAFGLNLPAARLSELARRGSGSAARSIFGGYVEMAAGTRADGSDAVARPLLAAADWPLSVVVAVTSVDRKPTSSGAGMELSRRTSPLYDAWVASVDGALAEARAAIAQRDFEALAAVAEHSSHTMHAVMQSSRPALMYWNAATVGCLHRVRALREIDGVAAFSTVDAGPQVKAVCLPGDAERVARALAEVPGVIDVHTVGLGPGAHLTDTTSRDAVSIETASDTTTLGTRDEYRA